MEVKTVPANGKIAYDRDKLAAEPQPQAGQPAGRQYDPSEAERIVHCLTGGFSAPESILSSGNSSELRAATTELCFLPVPVVIVRDFFYFCGNPLPLMGFAQTWLPSGY